MVGVYQGEQPTASHTACGPADPGSGRAAASGIAQQQQPLTSAAKRTGQFSYDGLFMSSVVPRPALCASHPELPVYEF